MTGPTREQPAELAGFASDELAGYEAGQDPLFASRLGAAYPARGR